MPVSALLLGSQDNIIYDKDVKRRFRLEFSTKLARRSYLIFANEAIEKKQYNNVEEILNECRQADDVAINNRDCAIDYINAITERLMVKDEDGKCPNIGRELAVDDDTRNLMLLYQRYCKETADEISLQYPLTRLTRTHLYWKAFKLAGALAVFDIDCDYCIHPKHYKAAIQFQELIYPDMLKFEKELAKEPYELFVSYCSLYSNKNECYLSLHELRKFGFLEGRVSKDTLDNFVKLVSSCDTNSEYTVVDNGIKCNHTPVKGYTGVSYKICTGSKQERARNSAEGYEYVKVPFTKLEDLLKQDMAYCPFDFIDGKRSNDNIRSGTNWAVLDVDESFITSEEAHLMLSDINHIIVRTSKPDNAYRYRVLIKFNTFIEHIDSGQWIKLIHTISEDLGLKADKLPISQIFYSYSTSKDTILATYDGVDLDVNSYLKQVEVKETEKKTRLTAKAKEALLDDRLTTFDRAYQAQDGEGRRKMVWALKYAQETLGASKEYTIDLIKHINSYWVKPMNEKELNSILKLVK